MVYLMKFLLIIVMVSGLEDGGWFTDSSEQIITSGICNIERRDANSFTQEEFEKRFADSQPVLVYNINNEKFRWETRRENLLKNWGDFDVMLNSANTYSYVRKSSTLLDYIENGMKAQERTNLGNETFYLFGDFDRNLFDSLLRLYNIPKWRLPGHSSALSFGIAAAGTGVPFHFHGPGFAEVIYGAKQWYLYPYEKRPEFDPNQSTYQWFVQNYTRVSYENPPFECLVRSGELIYFPNLWWHATLNTETSVFISTFLSP